MGENLLTSLLIESVMYSSAADGYTLGGDQDIHPHDPEGQEERKRKWQELSSHSDGGKPSLLKWAEKELMKTLHALPATHISNSGSSV